MEKLKSGNDFQVQDINLVTLSVRLWLTAAVALGISFIFGAVFYVWLHIQQVQNGYQLSKLYETHEQLLAVQRKLRLEWCRFDDPFQLEELGSKQFGLGPPKPEKKLIMR
jgi:hypothetical protein